jgi:hypothetical protein
MWKLYLGEKINMKIGIMQPYLFPYIGYFQLISAVDKWVVFDNVQYIRHGYINRNRILSQNLEKKWHYFQIPVSKSQQSNPINNISIATPDWREGIFGKLAYYKQIKAPYFDDVLELVKSSLSIESENLSEIIVNSLIKVTEYMDIAFPYSKSSKTEYDYSGISTPGDWAYEISRQEKADVYINPVGGRELFNHDKFRSADIELQFLKSNSITYRQSHREFIPSLSIIDLLMFNSRTEASQLLKEYELVC